MEHNLLSERCPRGWVILVLSIFFFHLYHLLTSPLLLMFIPAPLLNWTFVLLCFQAARQTKTPPEFIVAAAYNFSDDWIRISSSPTNHSVKKKLFLNIHKCWLLILPIKQLQIQVAKHLWGSSYSTYLRCKPNASFPCCLYFVFLLMFFAVYSQVWKKITAD